MVWDFRYGVIEPINDRYTPAPDELFGSAPNGHLAAPGKYSISMAKYHNGILTSIGNTQEFNCQLLSQSSTPAKDFASNINFLKKAVETAKQFNIVSGKFNNFKNRLVNIENAIRDMPADGKKILENSNQISKRLVDIEKALYGDRTRSSREFETKTSISSRINDAIYGVWHTTSDIPKTNIDSYEIGKKQFEKLIPTINELDNLIKLLENEVELKGGPYLGR
jgi:hypothetical protein